MKADQVNLPEVDPQRCASYTRESTSLGLEKEFNFLDAQEEACHRSILSQANLICGVLPEVFNDGGFTGANLILPACSRLSALAGKGRVDVVVVYKADRISRFLMDFLNFRGVFNNSRVSFVSITQNFSTANALGRLTINMLISFAEFELEIISEWTGYKIEAARRKGRWAVGPPSLGYSAAVNDGFGFA